VFPDKSNPQQQEANYSERLLVGYRFYDQHQIEPAFPFGHVSRFILFVLRHRLLCLNLPCRG